MPQIGHTFIDVLHSCPRYDFPMTAAEVVLAQHSGSVIVSLSACYDPGNHPLIDSIEVSARAGESFMITHLPCAHKQPRLACLQAIDLRLPLILTHNIGDNAGLREAVSRSPVVWSTACAAVFLAEHCKQQ